MIDSYPLHSIANKTGQKVKSLPSGEVFYTETKNSFVVAGDPKANSEQDKIKALQEFLEFAERNQKQVCGYYFSEQLSKSQQFQSIQVGVSRILNLEEIQATGPAFEEARRAIRKTKELSFKEITQDKLDWIQKIQQLDKKWFRTKRKPRIGFLLSKPKLKFEGSEGERWFVLIDHSGKIHSFISILAYKSKDKDCWYLDTMIQTPGGNRFALDSLICQVSVILKDEKCFEFSLGLCAFRNIEGHSLLENLFKLVGKTSLFYPAKGLYLFKKKYSNQEVKRYLLLNLKKSKFSQMLSILKVTYFQ